MMLRQISGIAKAEKVNAVVIAGDVYDRSIPPAEAVTLFSAFLQEMAEAEIPVFILSGNHDSPERLSFADGPLEKSGIYIAGGRTEPVRQVTLYDDLGPVHFFMLPFFKPALIGEKTSEEAVQRALSQGEGCPINTKERNVMITHFFVTKGGHMPEGLEEAGGLDSVDASLFSEFDYTALGHIHRAQRIGEGRVYYSGAPLAYSFSEAGSEKSVQLVTLRQKGEAEVERRVLRPLHKMRIVEGFLEELLNNTESETEREDYIQARLLDREELIDPIGMLRTVYPNIMQIVFAGREQRERTEGGYEPQSAHRRKSMPELFSEFYNLVRQEPMEEEAREVIAELSEELEREDEA